MSDNEIIEQLCAVIGEMSAIIASQATFINEQVTVDEAVKADFAKKRAVTDNKFAEICKRTTLPISQ